MATQRYISTSFWDDPWVCQLDPAEKFIYLYLMTNPLTNIAGVYEITVRRICFDTGYNNETVSNILERFHESGKALRWESYTIIPSWPKHQKWETRKQIEIGIEKILVNLPSELLAQLEDMSYSYPIGKIPITYTQGPSYSDLDKDKDIDKEAPKAKPNDNYTSDFLDFWTTYPSSEGKRPAFTAWKKLAKHRPPIGDIIAKLEAFKQTDKWKSGYVRNPATWINQRGWEDEIQTTHTQPTPTPQKELGYCFRHGPAGYRLDDDGSCPMCKELA
jgi:hypothetical protein